jgi:hypothetical protein
LRNFESQVKTSMHAFERLENEVFSADSAVISAFEKDQQ